MPSSPMFNQISLFKGSDFELSPFGMITTLLLAVFIGFYMIYAYFQKDSQAELVHAYHHANVLCVLFEKEPQLAQGNCGKAFDHELNESLLPSSTSTKNHYNSHPFGDNELFILFRAAGIVNADDVSLPSDIKKFSRFPGASYLTHLFQSEETLKKLNPKVSTLKMIVRLAGALGNQNTMNNAEAENQFYQFYLATALANIRLNLDSYPSAYDYVVNKMQAKDFSLETFKKEIDFSGNYWQVLPLSGTVLSNLKPPSDADVLSQLLIQKNVIKDSQQGWGIKKGKALKQLDLLQDNVTDEQRYQVFHDAQKLLLYLISQLHSHQQISDAREYAVKVRGYEQAGMFILASLILLIILLRLIRRLRENHQLKQLFILNEAAFKNSAGDNHVYQDSLLQALENFQTSWKWHFWVGYDNAIERIKSVVEGKLRQFNAEIDIEHLRAAINLQDEKLYGSRWVIRWAAITLPALGFIGTVRGILTSLTGADAIVWASTKAERADAISQLSGELGLAFATTFIALVAGVIVSLFNEQQTKSEGKFIQQLESWAVSTLDIHLFELYRKSHHGAIEK